jgi:hypothetical protein
MRSQIALGLIVCVLLMALVPGLAQSPRGKAELKAGAGSITIDYGRPSLKGRDMLSQLKEGAFWRMGTNQAAVLSTPVILTFGSVKVPAGSYSLWLKLAAPDKYELVFNSQTGQWGTMHDPSKDLFSVPLKKEAQTSPAEMFTLELKPAPKGGVLSLSWGSLLLSGEFQFAQ